MLNSILETIFKISWLKFFSFALANWHEHNNSLHIYKENQAGDEHFFFQTKLLIDGARLKVLKRQKYLNKPCEQPYCPNWLSD
jgi:hypothetical protein